MCFSHYKCIYFALFRTLHNLETLFQLSNPFSACSGSMVPTNSVAPNAFSLPIPYFFFDYRDNPSINLCVTLYYNASSYSLLAYGLTKCAFESIVGSIVLDDLLAALLLGGIIQPLLPSYKNNSNT